MARLLQGEVERFTSRARSLADQEAVLRERIRQSEAEIAGHQAEIRSAESQLALVLEEIATVKGLLRRDSSASRGSWRSSGAGRRSRACAGTAQSAVAGPRRPSARRSSRSLALSSERAEETANELATTRRDLAQAQQKLAAAADKLARITITAPVAGTVVDLKLKTPGGVVGAGDPLLDLVPPGRHPGAGSPRGTDGHRRGPCRAPGPGPPPGLQEPQPAPHRGQVREVSADRLADPKTGEPYYKARIVVPATALPQGITLAPGMPAEALIVTAERTFLGYLTQPLKDAFRRGLRES